jgi:hypothetical protein
VGIIHAGRMRYEGPLTELRDEVRRVRLAEAGDGTPPPGFALWRDETVDGGRTLVLRAAAAAWETAAWPGAEISRMTLEDIFIACVGASVARI